MLNYAFQLLIVAEFFFAHLFAKNVALLGILLRARGGAVLVGALRPVRRLGVGAGL